MSISGMGSVGSTITVQLALQQAQRSAEQARVAARTLQKEADSAERSADQAQARALDLRSRSRQKDAEAGQTEAGVITAKSSQQTQKALQVREVQVAEAVTTLQNYPVYSSTTAATSSSATTGSVINTSA